MTGEYALFEHLGLSIFGLGKLMGRKGRYIVQFSKGLTGKHRLDHMEIEY
jgi:hypothetical protein